MLGCVHVREDSPLDVSPREHFLRAALLESFVIGWSAFVRQGRLVFRQKIGFQATELMPVR